MESKTVNRRLNDREAKLQSEWIDNDRRARELLVKTAKAAPLIIEEDASYAVAVQLRA